MGSTPSWLDERKRRCPRTRAKAVKVADVERVTVVLTSANLFSKKTGKNTLKSLPCWAADVWRRNVLTGLSAYAEFVGRCGSASGLHKAILCWSGYVTTRMRR